MDRPVPDLLTRAASLLAREATRLPSAFSSAGAANLPHATESNTKHAAHAPSNTPPRCPVSGVERPAPGVPGADLPATDLRKQAHELIESLLGVLKPLGAAFPGVSSPGASSPGAWPSGVSPPATLPGMPWSAGAVPGGVALPAAPAGLLPGLGGASEPSGASSPIGLLGKVCPITQAAPQLPGFDRDQLRRQAHQFIETLLITFNEATGEKGLPAEDQVPLLHAEAPVQPGETARCRFRITNEEAQATEVCLYSTAFVADCGYEIPALRLSATPRRLGIPAGGEASFEVSIAVPQQTPRGKYSGLLQAMGYTYFKAVLTVNVL